ncbi:MAG: 3-methyladenine DNA glycosylase [Marmoricola sp.]
MLDRDAWQARAQAHAARVDVWVVPHLARRRVGEKHPVHDFLFSYYSQRPAALRRWHPGYGVALADAPEYACLKGYPDSAGRAASSSDSGRAASSSERVETRVETTTVSAEYLESQRPLIGSIRRLLVATASRPPTLSCLGLHEWAMVHRTDTTRHEWPLRLGGAGTDDVVESHRVGCSHFDAFRFFTDSARPLNTLRPGRDDRADFEQPGCLHAGMDLYKHAFRLTPLVASELVADCFALARDIRELDMRASPYDFGSLGFEPVRIETAGGKQEYVAAQRAFAERGALLRQRLVDECGSLLGAADKVIPPGRPDHQEV